MFFINNSEKIGENFAKGISAITKEEDKKIR